MRIHLRRVAVAALAGILAFGTIGVGPAQARHWHRANAAVLGAVAGLFGTIAVIAATQRYRDAYYDCYDCYGPYTYYPTPYAYGPAYGYGGWHHWHRHRWHH